MSKLLSTTEMVMNMDYHNTPYSFFGLFQEAWKSVEHQVIKLETKQSYVEKDNASWSKILERKYNEAISLLYKERIVDVDLYFSLLDKNIDFIRCRPIILPITEYLKWEIHCYKFNSIFKEKIYFLFRDSETAIFDEIANHDFMVFDRKIAFIHDYNNDGEILGGWSTTDVTLINNLIMIFSLIKSSSNNYDYFIKRNHINIEF